MTDGSATEKVPAAANDAAVSMRLIMIILSGTALCQDWQGR